MILWQRGDDPGYQSSVGGRWSIVPEPCGTTRAQSYDRMRDAKADALDIEQREQRR